MEQHITLIDGRNVSYWDVGEGPVLLFGHSFLWDKEMWRPQVVYLSQFYRCIVPDLWAHGGSDNIPAATFNLADIAASMRVLMERLAVERYAVIGLSVGGMWAAELALLAPTEVTALVIMDSYLGAEPEVSYDAYMNILREIVEQQAFTEQIAQDIAPLFFASSTSHDHQARVANFITYLTSIKGKRALDTAYVGGLIFGRRERLKALQALKVPCLIAVGEEDILRTPQESRLMHEQIDGSKLQVIPQAGHIVNLEQEDLVNQILQDFLANNIRHTVHAMDKIQATIEVDHAH